MCLLGFIVLSWAHCYSREDDDDSRNNMQDCVRLGFNIDSRNMSKVVLTRNLLFA